MRTLFAQRFTPESHSARRGTNEDAFAYGVRHVLSGKSTYSRGIVMDVAGHGNDNGAGPLAQAGDAHVKEVLGAAHEELKHLLRQRAEIMKTIAGLANIFGDEILNDELLELVDRKTAPRQPGFTKACRMVLMEAETAMGAREVCEHIRRRTPPVLLRHKDPLASVTTVLNRLVDYGEARSMVGENGRRVWQWVADNSTVVVQDVASYVSTKN
jgi:hypothetical protein